MLLAMSAKGTTRRPWIVSSATVEAYGDMSAATDANMAIQFYVGTCRRRPSTVKGGRGLRTAGRPMASSQSTAGTDWVL
jgi:hypothetical protein